MCHCVLSIPKTKMHAYIFYLHTCGVGCQTSPINVHYLILDFSKGFLCVFRFVSHLKLVSVIEWCAHIRPTAENISDFFIHLNWVSRNWGDEFSDLRQHWKYQYVGNVCCCRSYRDIFWTWYFRKLTRILLNSQAIHLHSFGWRHTSPVSFNTWLMVLRARLSMRK